MTNQDALRLVVGLWGAVWMGLGSILGTGDIANGASGEWLETRIVSGLNRRVARAVRLMSPQRVRAASPSAALNEKASPCGEALVWLPSRDSNPGPSD